MENWYNADTSEINTELPVELTMKIIELVYHLPDGRPDVQMLSACSLVCKQWFGLARPLLYRYLAVGDFTSPERIRHLPFDKAIVLLRGPGNLGTCVRSIRMHIDASGACFTEFITILSHCPRVYRLDLEVTLHWFTSRELEQIAALPVRIRALELTMGSPASPVLYQLLKVWPSIQFLYINTEVIAAPPLYSPSFTLYELSTRRSLPVQVFRWLLPPLQDGKHTPDLRVLDCWDPPSDEISHVIAEYAPHVRSLRLVHPPKHDFLDDFTALEEFTLRSVPDLFPLPPLPQTVQHLHVHSFIVPTGTFLQSLRYVIDAIKALPRLRFVTVNQPIAQRHDFGDLVRACEEQAVEMVVDPA
ncbi:hypothetical protein EWM64_g7161, partial [Hericium alpestre]